jgi:5-methylcytosine-specific restriction endonuclease McrA
MTVRVLEGDCREMLRGLPDRSVHCVVTSPPYFGLRSYLPADHPAKAAEMGSETSPLEFVQAPDVLLRREARCPVRGAGSVRRSRHNGPCGGPPRPGRGADRTEPGLCPPGPRAHRRRGRHVRGDRMTGAVRRCSYCPDKAGTRDHILPRAWGQVSRLGVRATRPACQRCNLVRSVCGHCPAAMATLRCVLGDRATYRSELRLAALWGWVGRRAQLRAVTAMGCADQIHVVRASWPPMPAPAASFIHPKRQPNGL